MRADRRLALTKARMDALKRQGRNAFTEYQIPQAVITLKQGAGRLIRSETDRGLLVVCDPRMSSMGYGKRLRLALPAMPRLESEDDAMGWLAGLASQR